MCFGKFLFIYLLGKNVDFFTYKRILDITIANNEDNNDGGPDIDPGFALPMSYKVRLKLGH
jgi:hypothetical protein